MDVVVSQSRLRRILFVLLFLVVGAGVAVEVLRPIYHLRSRSGIVPFLSMSYEGNVPTFYTVALLALCSLLLAISASAAKIAQNVKKRFVLHWWILSAGFFYIAIDEIFEFHEMAGTFVKLSGLLYFSWVLPASALLVVLGIFYFPFLRHLNKKTRIRFLIAGAIYVGGAVGMELPLGYWTDKHGSHNLGYGLIDAVEEAMEMLGLNLFLLALVAHLAEKEVSVRFSSGGLLDAAPSTDPKAETEPS